MILVPPRTGSPPAGQETGWGCLLALCCAGVIAQLSDGTDIPVTGHIFKPALKEDPSHDTTSF